MDLFSIILSAFLMFTIIYLAVRLAIKPLILFQQEEIYSQEQDFGLIKLREIDVISNDELEEIIELYNSKVVKNEDYQVYQKYANVLKQLKELGYFTNEDYSDRIIKLKNHFKII